VLTGSSPSTPQRPASVAPARSERAAPRQDHGSDAAQAFRDKLQALSKDKPQAPRDLRKREVQGAEDLAFVATPVEVKAEHPARGKQDSRVPTEVTAAPAQPHEARAEMPAVDLGGSRAGDTASMTLTAKFAERLALPGQGVAETHVQLDTARYLVSSVTVSGLSEEGMSLSYQGGSADGEGASQDEEALRQRLEARGLKVSGIRRRS
jgi:hypothetical protein